MPKWEFGFALPNLKMGRDSFGNDRVVIVQPEDSRLQLLRSASDQVEAIMSSFTDTFGREYEPAAMLMFLPDAETSMMEDMLNVRNALAISTIVRYAGSLLRSMRHGSSSLDYLYSDYFDFCPIVPGPNGMLTLTSGSLLGADDRKSFRGQCSPGLVYPARYDCQWDHDLATQLLGLEDMRSTGAGSAESASVFRSLQIAYQAGRNPVENRMTTYDIGTRIVLWTSALEVLLHAGREHVGRRDVTDFVASCRWLHEDLLKNDVPRKIIDRLYDSRNDYAHGNDIAADHGIAFPEVEDSPNIVFVAPIIYWMVLREKIGQLWADLRIEDSMHGHSWFGDPCIETLVDLYMGDDAT